MNKVWMLLLSLLGFAGCGDEENGGGEGSYMYGTPYAEYTVKGRVKDAAGRPIAGIEVRRPFGVPDPAAVRTDAQGAYVFEASENVLYRPPVLTFTDTDGPAGGGDFAEKEVEVVFTESDRTGQREGSWMYGRFERTGVDVVLDEKTEKK
ncbi:radical SAM-associated putative lipoprotein [Alistipes shahii]